MIRSCFRPAASGGTLYAPRPSGFHPAPGIVRTLYTHDAAHAAPSGQSTRGRSSIRLNVCASREPKNAMCTAPQNTAAASTVPTAANGCARSDSKGRRLAALAKAVVIPQVGQGFPIVTTQLHSAKPICLWVPIPRSEGVRDAAVTRTASTPTATIAAAIRSPRVARAERRPGPGAGADWPGRGCEADGDTRGRDTQTG